MMPLKGSRPAEVNTAPPNGIDPCLRSSLKGPVPPRRLMAPETPCGSSNPSGLTAMVLSVLSAWTAAETASRMLCSQAISDALVSTGGMATTTSTSIVSWSG